MRPLLLVPFCVIAFARTASADTASRIADFAQRAADKLDRYNIEPRVAEALAKAAIGRTRRAIAIGPQIGGVGLIDAKDSASGGGITFGLGLYTFHVPTGLALREVVKERVKVELRAAVARGEIDGDALVHDIIEKVIRDVLEGAYGAQTFPTPALTIILEGQKTFGDADGFGVRAMVGYGISKVNLGLSLAGTFPDDAKAQFALGPEVGIRLTPIGKMRTPVFDVFARAEFGVRSPNPATVQLGARVLLDVL
jgi:hypothetical protein